MRLRNGDHEKLDPGLHFERPTSRSLHLEFSLSSFRGPEDGQSSELGDPDRRT